MGRRGHWETRVNKVYNGFCGHGEKSCPPFNFPLRVQKVSDGQPVISRNEFDLVAKSTLQPCL